MTTYSGTVTDQTPAEPSDALWSRLHLIEGQPLAERAAAYTALHEELSRRLESAPTDPVVAGGG